MSAASNRSEADKDPAQWLPSDGSYHCVYAATWIGTKLRWDLAVVENERQALLGLAEDCPTTTVVYEVAPWPRAAVQGRAATMRRKSVWTAVVTSVSGVWWQGPA
ncbi:hypothetical protein [Streptomyces sirii]|uniref:hypothetical protein n=1 Tax=Streptomyces sirii TaxID=3127701 RepID=UPI003D365036